jgi:hypothetical protein
LGNTTDNGLKFQVNGHLYGTGIKLDPGNSIYWQDLNTHIQRNTSNQLEFQEYTGQFILQGMTGFGLFLSHPTNGMVDFTFPAYRTFALRNLGANILQTSALDEMNCWVKLGASQAQYGNGPGANLYLFGGPGGSVGAQNGGNVYIDAGDKGNVSAVEGNILIATQKGKVGIGTTTPSAQFHTNGTVRFAGLTNDNAQTRVLVSDANGNLSYRDASTLGGASSTAWTYGGNAVSALSAIGTTNSNALTIITNNQERIRVDANGNVGINNTSPDEKLTVSGNVRLNRAIEQFMESDGISELIRFRNSMSSTEGNPKGGFDFAHFDGTSVMRITNDKVGIGTTNPQAKLAVNGDIFSKKIKVTQTGWPDYVFHRDYSLLSLTQVEKFIEQHHHLPEVPSAAEIEKNGLDLGDNQTILLKKIEELTLYIIQQDKRIQELEKKMQTINSNSN